MDAFESVSTAPIADAYSCREREAHDPTTRHAGAFCPVEIELRAAEVAEREGEAAFMRRYPGVL